jgi:bacteriocin-like protein
MSISKGVFMKELSYDELINVTGGLTGQGNTWLGVSTMAGAIVATAPAYAMAAEGAVMASFIVASGGTILAFGAAALIGYGIYQMLTTS